MKFVVKGAQAAFVLPTRNRKKRLLQTLGHISATPGPDMEIVVVDNASEDGTPDVVRREYPNLKLICLDSNVGTTARNIGADATDASVIIMLDDDSYPEAGVVEKLMAAMEDERLGIAACMIQLPEGKWEEGGSKFVHIGCGAAVRKEQFLRYGGYPPVYETYVEEYDLAYRYLADGHAVRFDDSWIVRHEPAARSDFNYMVEKLTLNNIYLAWKFFSDDEAVRFTDWNAYRLKFLAVQKGAMDGYKRALVKSGPMKSEAQKCRAILPDFALDLVIPRRHAKLHMAPLSDLSGPVGFLRAGKEILDLALAAKELRVDVAAIYDDGLLKDVGKIAGVEVLPLCAAADFAGTLIAGGTSPGFIRNTQCMAKKTGFGEILCL